MVVTLVWIAVAGALGAMTRWWLGFTLLDVAFPYVTLGCNLLGSFLLGWLLAGPVLQWNERVRLAMTTGFLGSFTTFSAFGYEWFALVSKGDFIAGAVYVVLSVGGGLAAAWLGNFLGARRQGVST
jgi:CrcB protein